MRSRYATISRKDNALAGNGWLRLTCVAALGGCVAGNEPADRLAVVVPFGICYVTPGIRILRKRKAARG